MGEAGHFHDDGAADVAVQLGDGIGTIIMDGELSFGAFILAAAHDGDRVCGLLAGQRGP